MKITEYFLDVPLADGSAIGRQLAVEIVKHAKAIYKPDLFILRGFLNAWNERSGSPYDSKFIEDLLLVEPSKEKKNYHMSVQNESRSLF